MESHPCFSLLFIGTLAERKQDTPHCESVLFHPVLKDIPNIRIHCIITAHISLGDLNRQLWMFNHQKTLAAPPTSETPRPTASITLCTQCPPRWIFQHRQHLQILQANHTISSTVAQNWVRIWKNYHHLKIHNLREAYYPFWEMH